jgi:hypothetical protein
VQRARLGPLERGDRLGNARHAAALAGPQVRAKERGEVKTPGFRAARLRAGCLPGSAPAACAAAVIAASISARWAFSHLIRSMMHVAHMCCWVAVWTTACDSAAVIAW